MPAPGQIDYSPNARFAMNRAYLKFITVTSGGWPVSWDGTTLSVTVGNPVQYVNYVVFKPEFIVWNSNVYTLDWIVEDHFYQVPGHPPSPSGIGLSFYPNPPTLPRPGLLVDLIATGTPWETIALPPSPPGWWSG